LTLSQQSYRLVSDFISNTILKLKRKAKNIFNSSNGEFVEVVVEQWGFQ